MVKKKSKKKALKMLIVLLCSVFLFNSVIAVWLFSYDKLIIGDIISGEPLEIVIDFNETFLIDVTNESKVYSDDLSLLNFNGDTNMTTIFNITKVPANSECDFESDCSTELFKDELELTDSQNFTLSAGENNFYLNVSCKKRSCEQNITIDINFEEIIPI